MFYQQLLPLRSLVDAPVTKIFVLFIKATQGQNLIMSSLNSSANIQTVTALHNNTRQPGTKHTEPEGVAGEQSKEDVGEEATTGVFSSKKI